jgi:hypothetical protein
MEDLRDRDIMNLIAEETILQQVKTQAERSQDEGLQLKVKEAEEEEKQFLQAYGGHDTSTLPLPPPLLLVPQLAENRGSWGTKRGNLLEEIRNNKLKLNHVSKVNECMNLDISNMNKEERMDHAERLREKLRMRKKALNRREASDEEDS